MTVVVDIDGNMVEGDYKPSSDVYSHLYIYRHRPDVGGVVHTHSAYATAFAAVNVSIPVVLTAIADEFGGPIPGGALALIGDDAIGKVVLSIGKSPAVAQEPRRVHDRQERQDGCEGCVMTEDNAKTVWLALQIGTPDTIPQDDVDSRTIAIPMCMASGALPRGLLAVWWLATPTSNPPRKRGGGNNLV